VVDSNASPDGVDYPIPGNDDAMRAISLYCELAKGAILDGLQAELMASGGDIGASEAAPAEAAVEEAVADAAPVEEAPAEQAQAEEAPAEQAQAEEAPAEEAQAEEAPSA